MYSSASRDDSIPSLKSSNQNIKDQSAADAKESLLATANKAGTKVREFIDSATDEFTNASDAVTSRIQDKPMQSALIALGVGVLAGLLFRRR